MKRISVSRIVAAAAAAAAVTGFWAAPAMAAAPAASVLSRQIPAYVGPETFSFEGFGPTAAQAISAAQAARASWEQTHVAGNGPCTESPYGSEYEGICQAYYYAS